MKIEVQPNCPLNGFEKCKQFECAWFMQMKGEHPQTGEPLDDYGCSMAWMPIILLENSKLQNETGSAVESFRNEMVKAQKNSVEILLETAKQSNSNIKFINGEGMNGKQ